MQIFKSKSPITRLEKQLADAQAQRGRIAERLVEAERTVEQHRSAAVTMAVDGGDPTAVEVSMRAAQDRLATLSGALRQIDATIEKTARELAEARDEETRRATAFGLNELAIAFHDDLPSILASFAKIAEHSGKASVCVPEATGLQRFAENASSETMAAAEMIIHALRATAESVLAGGAPATLPVAVQESISPPPAPTRGVILKFDSRWSVSPGIQRTLPGGWRIDLPLDTAERALAAGLVFMENDPKAAELIAERGSSPHVVNPAACIDLDAAEPKPPPSPPPRQITYSDLPRNQTTQGWRASPSRDQF